MIAGNPVIAAEALAASFRNCDLAVIECSAPASGYYLPRIGRYKVEENA